ncbi:DUF3046 domain-containing protein [Microbacterium gorillae]|uniref:DUF3046 domain-containing protein n=1 Tax=Microbacterium gorillae TaxID=1231063 RepID=UPI00058E0463|nr:DUF3046 domain-containing protein [Microbacterium gorillae]
MRRSEFLRAVSDEFGARGETLIQDLHLVGADGLTAVAALEAGIPPKQIWLALCAETEVPESRRYGVARPEITRH